MNGSHRKWRTIVWLQYIMQKNFFGRCWLKKHNVVKKTSAATEAQRIEHSQDNNEIQMMPSQYLDFLYTWTKILYWLRSTYFYDAYNSHVCFWFLKKTSAVIKGLYIPSKFRCLKQGWNHTLTLFWSITTIHQMSGILIEVKMEIQSGKMWRLIRQNFSFFQFTFLANLLLSEIQI